MGFLAIISASLGHLASALPLWQLLLLACTALIPLVIVCNVLHQLVFKNPNEPPIVFYLLPFIGSTITYGIDPFKFFFSCREKYGNVFTFILLGKKTTVCLGVKGNDFILNGKMRDVNAEEVYTPLTTPVFGKDVIYDCPNAKLMEQKKFVKVGLTSDAFKSYVALIANEVEQFVAATPAFQGSKGKFNVSRTMAEITIYTASRSLQGKEVRERFDSKIADLYHDLDMGFTPINFMLPSAPLPHNRRRDFAQKRMTQVYMDIIQERKKAGDQNKEEDMIRNLMSCVYKNGTPVPDREIAHMMIAFLMAGQHSSSSSSAWIMLRLATRPDIQEELLAEQERVLGKDLPALTYETLQNLTLNSQVVKETLRIHAPIHSMMRKVKSPMSITVDSPTTSRSYNIPVSHTLLAAPGVTSRLPEHFPEPMLWEPHRWDEGNPLACKTSSKNSDPENEKDEQIDYGYGMVSKGTASPYLPFGAGRHRCIGEQFAYVQLGTILATLVRLLKVNTVEGRDGKVAETDYSSLFSRPLEPTEIRWERRQVQSTQGTGNNAPEKESSVQ